MNKVIDHIFREYDIRGTVEKELTNEFAHLLGRAFAQTVLDCGKRRIAIGYDCRHSSPGFAKNFAQGVAAEGLEATITGMGPTPQLYYAVYALGYDAGVQITGSHNPPDMNGFKMCIGTDFLSGPAIQALKEKIKRLDATKNHVGGSVLENLIREQYTKMLIDNSSGHFGPRKLKIVVDAGNGVGGLVGPAILRALGCEVIELFCDPDGNFPNHHPDPTVLENIEDLIAKVKETKADFGIGWDGDADRIGVVDERGQVIFGDMLLLLYAREILNEVPNPTIIGDVKCSSLLFSDLKKRGANPIMWKTGHSLVKSKLKETGGELAGEMSGHICFKHRYYGFDDALYSSVRFAEIVSKTDKAVSTLLSDLPKMVSTPEIRVDCPEEIKFKIPEKALKAFAEYDLTTIDGVRIGFPNGWGLIRASNTQPVLVMRFEATDTAALEQIQKIVTGKLEEIKASF